MATLVACLLYAASVDAFGAPDGPYDHVPGDPPFLYEAQLLLWEIATA